MLPPKDNIASTPENVEHQAFIVYDEEESPIRPDETPGDHYYRTYTDRRVVDLHAPVWKLKQGDSFYDWQVCRDWFQGAFPPAEIKFQEEQTHDRTYRAYLQETVISTSTTHRIVREWRSMHKEWDDVDASKKDVAEEKAKVQKMEEWSAIGWKKKAEAEAAILAEERKLWKEACARDNNEKRTLRNEVVSLKAEIEMLKKETIDAEAARDEA
ncbi:hypothetical protein Hanom_Chr02g00125911 [Helianthus anomalus]